MHGRLLRDGAFSHGSTEWTLSPILSMACHEAGRRDLGAKYKKDDCQDNYFVTSAVGTSHRELLPDMLCTPGRGCTNCQRAVAATGAGATATALWASEPILPKSTEGGMQTCVCLQERKASS